MKTIALLHPGNMGSTIGACAAAGGARVLWVAERRSAATRERAQRRSLIESASLTEALGQSEVVLSVCPPEFAVETAESVAAQKFRGFHWRLAGTLQFEDADRTIGAGDSELIVEHRSRRAGAASQRAAQNLDPGRRAFERHLAPGARKGR